MATASDRRSRRPCRRFAARLARTTTARLQRQRQRPPPLPPPRRPMAAPAMATTQMWTPASSCGFHRCPRLARPSTRTCTPSRSTRLPTRSLGVGRNPTQRRVEWADSMTNPRASAIMPTMAIGRTRRTTTRGPRRVTNKRRTRWRQRPRRRTWRTTRIRPRRRRTRPWPRAPTLTPYPGSLGPRSPIVRFQRCRRRQVWRPTTRWDRRTPMPERMPQRSRRQRCRARPMPTVARLQQQARHRRPRSATRRPTRRPTRLAKRLVTKPWTRPATRLGTRQLVPTTQLCRRLIPPPRPTSTPTLNVRRGRPKPGASTHAPPRRPSPNPVGRARPLDALSKTTSSSSRSTQQAWTTRCRWAATSGCRRALEGLAPCRRTPTPAGRAPVVGAAAAAAAAFTVPTRRGVQALAVAARGHACRARLPLLAGTTCRASRRGTPKVVARGWAAK
ncbi:hypothetical protein BU14_0526s0008 [Porphyra umbilicalis]|uniref:Uncharacterized protein n=1 Tax=Porphyra umbilicalis TaxID=2786 RepID=A0A1X6NSF1_PORUM|nr:hypothetical protein BU14_0526s0008 [Porphyra umbilicalis]|eukprot:OSX71507.1 hypothetical protein BU14_0526s0008 [Porphyra umbilicalis]